MDKRIKALKLLGKVIGMQQDIAFRAETSFLPEAATQFFVARSEVSISALQQAIQLLNESIDDEFRDSQRAIVDTLNAISCLSEM